MVEAQVLFSIFVTLTDPHVPMKQGFGFGFTWIIPAGMVLSFTACNQADEAMISKLEHQNDSLGRMIEIQDSIVARVGIGAKFVNAYLDSLDGLEQSIRKQLHHRDNDSIIVAKVKALTSLVQINRSIIDDLKSTLGEGNLPAQLLLDHLLRLDNKVKMQEVRIAMLNNDLEEMGDELRSVLGVYAELATLFEHQKNGLAQYKTQVQELESQLQEKSETLESRETSLNTAYFYFGDKKELLSMGILKKSNFITQELNENIRLSELNKVDIRYFESIMLPVSNFKIISKHPENSFRIITVDEGVKLVILDSKHFWSVTKTLIIQTG